MRQLRLPLHHDRVARPRRGAERAGRREKPEAKRPWEVRAHFAGGAAVSFDLQQWEGSTLTGRSRNFGPVTFDSQYIRRLQFNLGTSQKTSDTNTGGADQLWPWDD